MGSLDIRSAKRQFFMLVDSVSSSHLPSFAIWLDAKMAEYKTNGLLKPDDDEKENQPYPEWISKSLRNNLSFIFQGDNQSAIAEQNASLESRNMPQNSQSISGDRTPVKRKLDSDNSHGGKRPSLSDRSISSDSTHFTVTAETCNDASSQLPDTIVIKEELVSEDEASKLAGLSHAIPPRPDNTVTPMPLVQDTFSMHSNPTASLCNYPSVSSVGNVASGNTSTFARADASLHSPMKGSSIAFNETLQNPLGFNVHQQLTPSSVKPKEQFTPLARSPSFAPPSQPFDGLKPDLRNRITLEPPPKTLRLKVQPGASGSKARTEGENLGRCLYCAMSFPSKVGLRMHLIERKLKQYRCHLCDAAFSVICNLRQHESVHHSKGAALS